MTINPRDYDPTELREMARKRDDVGSPSGTKNGSAPKNRSNGSSQNKSNGASQKSNGAGRNKSNGAGRNGSGGAAAKGSSVPDPSEIQWGNLENEAEKQSAAASASDSLRAGMYRELLPLVGTDNDVSKPYLRQIPDNYSAEVVVFEWLEFLQMHAGFRGATDALAFYESVDWITEDVAARLEDYLLGIDEGELDNASSLDMDDHMLSLVYISKLVGMQ